MQAQPIISEEKHLRVVLLVRDPRGIFNSRKSIFSEMSDKEILKNSRDGMIMANFFDILFEREFLYHFLHVLIFKGSTSQYRVDLPSLVKKR